MTSKAETILKHTHNLENRSHSKKFLEFYRWLTEEQDSSSRNGTAYLNVLRMFSIHIGKTKIDSVTKDLVLSFLDKRKKSIELDPEKRWERTWNDYLERLIGFYRWLANQDSDKNREEWNTPEPFCSIKKKKNKRYSSYSPNDVWSIDELLLAVKYCENLRDKVILTMCWDMAFRSHEICKMRIRDIVVKEKYAEASTSWDTKTGTRTNPIIVGFPYLRDLLNIHPFALDPNAFLILSSTTLKPLSPDSLWTITDTLKKKITKMMKETDDNGEPVIKDNDREMFTKLLQKPWNPYLLGRHSSITEKTDDLNDFQLKQYAGWEINSTRPKTYVHRKGKQVIKPLLEKYGLEEPKVIKLNRKTCPKCKYVNTVESTICTQCSFVLNKKGWEYLKTEEKEKEKELKKTISIQSEKIEMMEKKMEEKESHSKGQKSVLDRHELILKQQLDQAVKNEKKLKKMEEKLANLNLKSSQNTLEFCCADCSIIHTKEECPNCGSKIRRIYDSKIM